MIPRKMVVMAVCLLLSGAAWAAAGVTVGSVSGDAGATIDLPVAFDPGGGQVSAIQFSLTLPPALSTVSVTLGAAALAADKAVSTQFQGGTWKFIVFGLNQNPVSAGALLTASMTIAPGTAAGDLAVPVSAMVFADSAGNPVPAGAGTAGTVHVLSGGAGTSPLPAPDLSKINGHVFLVNDSIMLDYPYAFTGFVWTLTANAAATSGAPASQQAALASPVKTQAARFDLGAQSTKPGAYQLTVAAQKGTQTSPTATAVVTLVASNLNAVRVFPNPWKSNQHAGNPVTFSNLSLGSTIKIFTASGHLVRTLTPIGSVGLWDRKNDHGDLAASGIYLYVITDGHGNKTRGKVALVK